MASLIQGGQCSQTQTFSILLQNFTLLIGVCLQSCKEPIGIVSFFIFAKLCSANCLLRKSYYGDISSWRIKYIKSFILLTKIISKQPVGTNYMYYQMQQENTENIQEEIFCLKFLFQYSKLKQLLQNGISDRLMNT